MSQRQLDEQIRQAFSALTRPPRPQLTERIRDGLWVAAGRTVPPALPLPPPLTIVVAVLVVAAIVAALLEGPAAARAATAFGQGVNAAVARSLSPPRTAAPAGQPAAAGGN